MIRHSRLWFIWAAWFSLKRFEKVSQVYTQLIVGGIVLSWANIETGPDGLALVAYHSGGDKFAASLPRSLSRKIQFLKIARRRINLPPERSKCGRFNGHRRISLSGAARAILEGIPRRGRSAVPPRPPTSSWSSHTSLNGPVFSDFAASVEYVECHLLFRQNRNGGDGDGELTKDLRNVYNGLAQVQWCDIARYHYSAARWD